MKKFLIISLVLVSTALGAQRGADLFNTVVQVLAGKAGKPTASDTAYTQSYSALLSYSSVNDIPKPTYKENRINNQLLREIEEMDLKLDYLFKFQTVSNLQFAMLNMVKPGSDATVAGSPNFTLKGGFTTSGTANYIKTGFTPSLAQGHFKLDSASYGGAIVGHSSAWMMGARSGSTDAMLRTSPGLARLNSLGGVYFTFGSNSDTLYYCITRAGNTVKVFINGAQRGGTHTSTPTQLSPDEFYLLTANEGDGPGALNHGRILAAWAGGYVPDDKQAGFFNALQSAIRGTAELPLPDGTSGSGGGQGSTGGGSTTAPNDSNLLPLDSSWVFHDNPTIADESRYWFDGNTSTSPVFDGGDKAVHKHEIIPGTGLTGQIIYIDLQGTTKLDAIRYYDGTGSSLINFYGCKETVYEYDTIASINTSDYNKWKIIEVADTFRYLMIHRSGDKVVGINDLQLYGTIQDSLIIPQRNTPGRTVYDSWGVTTHDYDHVASRDTAVDGYKNIFDINPFANARTYVEFSKNFSNGIVYFKDRAPGALEWDQMEKFKERQGKLMLAFRGSVNQIKNKYPSGYSKKDDLPWSDWNKDSTQVYNMEARRNPSNWLTMLQIHQQVADSIAAYGGLQETIIYQPNNEGDAVYRNPYHYLDPFAYAAMASMLWDGHEGEYGEGLKDKLPNVKIAMMAHAYNNIGYLKLARMAFRHLRSDDRYCTDMVAVNAYCTDRFGVQWAPNAKSMPPENRWWVNKLAETSSYVSNFLSEENGDTIEFWLTEFGADHISTYASKTAVWIDSAQVHEGRTTFNYCQRYSTTAEKVACQDSIFYNDYYPKYADSLLYIQAVWNLRYFLEASRWCDGMTIFHIRDGEGVMVWNLGTYASSGIAFNKKYDYRAQLMLKPSGLLLKEFYDELADYVLVDRVQVGQDITMTFENSEGHQKFVQWESTHSSKPVITE